MKNVKINIIGNPFTEDGFGNHTRNIAKALFKIADTTIETQTMPGWETKADNEIYQMVTKWQEDKDKSNMVDVMIGQPHIYPLFWNRPRKAFIGFVVFEGSKIPSGWIDILEDNRVTAIFAPSNHVKEAIESAGVKKKVYVVSEGVDSDLFKNTDPLPELKFDGFTFLFNKGWSQGARDRSGLDILLRAFIEEFGNDPKVRLLIKTNAAYGDPSVAIKKIIDEYPDKKPVIVQVSSNIPYNKLPNLYSSANVFVAPTKAEGFGLNIAEAMSCELPTIATGYGGHRDFFTDDVGFSISYKMHPATDSNKMYEDALWSMPDKTNLQQHMIYCYKNYDKVKDLGIKGREKIKNGFQWSHSADKVITAINELF